MHTFSAYKNTVVHFKRWTRRREAVMLSLHKLIRIGVLSFSLTLLSKPVLVYSQVSDTLPFSENVELEEVEITGEGAPDVFSQLARTVTVITAEQISSSPAQTIQDLLEYASGIDIRQRNTHGVQADIQLRGGTFDQVMVLLNGINITDPQTGHFNLNIPVDLSSVERIEILHGSGARVYGANAYKGVINIITREEPSGISVKTEAGQYGLFNSSAGAWYSGDKHHHHLAAGRSVSGGYTENTDFNIRNLFYRGGASTRFADISWQGGLNSKAFGANDFYSPAFPMQYEETGTNFVSLGFTSGERIRFGGNVYRRSHKDHFLLVRDDPSFYENYHRTGITGISLFSIFKSRLGTTRAGFDIRHENILSTVLGEELDEPVAVPAADSAYYTREYRRRYTGLYFEQKYTRGNFFVSGGILLSQSPEYHKDIHIFPGLDLAWYPGGNDLKLFASGSRSLRLPTFTDLFYSDPQNRGNADLQPEELLSLEAGILYSPGDISARMSLFDDFGKDVIDWVMLEGSSVYQSMNIAEVNSRGIEWQLDYSAAGSAGPVRISRLMLAYTFTGQVIGQGNYESKYAGDFLRHKLTGILGLRISKGFSTEITSAYQSRNGSYQDLDATGTRITREFSPYWLTDMKISYRKSWFTAFAKASNLFDVSYNDVGNLVQPGRWISAGIGVRWDRSE